MRFPAGTRTIQESDEGSRSVLFFEEANGEWVAIVANRAIRSGDFESVLATVLADGPCTISIAAEIFNKSEPNTFLTGALRIEVARDGASAESAFRATASVVVEIDESRMETVWNSDLAYCLEMALATVRHSSQFVPKLCCSCKYGSYEDSCSIGFLRCYYRERDRFEAAAAKVHDDPKYRLDIFELSGFPIEEFSTCAEFSPRESPWGYRDFL